MAKKRGVAALLIGGALIAAACGGSGDDDTSSDTTAAGSTIAAIVPTTAAANVTAAPSTAPANANLDAELKFAWLGTSRTLDPAKGSLADWVHAYPIFDRLTRIDDNLQVVPMLAEKWAFSPDGKTMTITLRKDILFQDSSPIDSAAVKANLERSKTLQGSLVAAALANIASIETPDSTTVKLNLSGSGASLPATFAGGSGMMINPKAFASPTADLTAGPGKGNGSGPYEVTDFKAAESTSYARTSQKYWDPAAGQLKAFSLKFSGGSAAGLNGVKAGDFDLAQISGTDVATAQADAKAGRIKAVEAPQLTTQNDLYFRSDKAGSPASNQKFRQAVQYAVDKKSIADGLFSGNCRVASQYLTKEHWAYSTATESKYTFDQAKAKALLAESGVTNPTFTVTYAQGQTIDPIVQAVKQQLAAVGITMNLAPAPAANAAVPFQQGQVDAGAGQLSGFINVEPSNFLSNYILDKATSGVQVGYDTDGSLAKAAAEAADVNKSLAERAKLYDAIWQKIADQAWFVPICNQTQLWAANPNKPIQDKIQIRWSGLPDFRYVYVTK
ncbi:MAG: ABC transporter substrate-binding protein [Acidimicrobiia bacterium]